jgi:hypothetical protein
VQRFELSIAVELLELLNAVSIRAIDTSPVRRYSSPEKRRLHFLDTVRNFRLQAVQKDLKCEAREVRRAEAYASVR